MSGDTYVWQNYCLGGSDFFETSKLKHKLQTGLVLEAALALQVMEAKKTR